MLASGQTAFPDVPFEGLRTTRVAADGSFSFSNVSPASTRCSRAAPAPLPQWASTDILVDGDRVSGLSLSLQPGLTLSGSVLIRRRPVASPRGPADRARRASSGPVRGRRLDRPVRSQRRRVRPLRAPGDRARPLPALRDVSRSRAQRNACEGPRQRLAPAHREHRRAGYARTFPSRCSRVNRFPPQASYSPIAPPP
jgi:hypothetical protein